MLSESKAALGVAGATIATPVVDWLGWASRGVTLLAGVLGIILTVVLIREHLIKPRLLEQEEQDHKKAPPST